MLPRISLSIGLLLAALGCSFAGAQAAFAAEEEAGFVSLFDGKTLGQWQGSLDGYKVKDDGALLCLKKGGGNLYTKKEYADFVFRFDFKLTSGANNGLGIRTPLTGNPAYAGMEIQILDNTADVYKNLKSYQYHGSVYGVVSAKRGFLKPLGQWNSQEVSIKGNHIVVTLNGEVIVDADLKNASTPQTIDGKAHPGLKLTKGHIAFCGHGAELEFRKMRIKELK